MRLRLSPVLVAALVALLIGGASPAAPAEDFRVPEDVRSISYFPARGGWTLMWTRFDPAAIDRDFARIALLRANTVRVIVPARVFGYPEPEPAMSARLERVVDLAARHGLRVELTLFDWWHDYADVAGARRWAAALLSPYTGDARIALVELKNELRPQDAGAAEWAAALIPYVRELTQKPVTVSVPALDAARDLRLLRSALGSAQPDFYSAHFYWRTELAAEHLEAARAAASPLPLRVAETGYSTAIPYDIVPGVPESPSAREAQQAYYLRSLAAVARRLGLPPIGPWVLSDFAPDAIPSDDPGVHGNPREYRFGLFRVSGEAKPAAAALRTIFSGGDSQDFNNGFEQAVRGEGGESVPALWRIRAARGAAFRRDAQVARSGRASARIEGRAAATRTGRRLHDRSARSGSASGRPLHAHRIRARGLALRRDSCRAALVRRRRTGAGRRAVAPLRCGTSAWQRLRVSGSAPSGAAYVGLYLRAGRTVGPAWFDDVGYSCVRGGND